MIVIPAKKHKRIVFELENNLKERNSEVSFLEKQVKYYRNELDRSIENCNQLESSLEVTNSKLKVTRNTISNKNLEISELKEEVKSLTIKEITRLEALMIRTKKIRVKKKCRDRILDYIQRMIELE